MFKTRKDFCAEKRLFYTSERGVNSYVFQISDFRNVTTISNIKIGGRE